MSPAPLGPEMMSDFQEGGITKRENSVRRDPWLFSCTVASSSVAAYSTPGHFSPYLQIIHLHSRKTSKIHISCSSIHCGVWALHQQLPAYRLWAVHKMGYIDGAYKLPCVEMFL